MQRADVKAVMHTTQCPYFELLLGSERNTPLSVLLFSYLEGIFLYFFSTKDFFFSLWVCWSCLLPSEVLNSVVPCGFQHLCLSTLTCKLLANRMVSPGFGLGVLAYERIFAGSLAGWCQCAWGILQVEQQGKERQIGIPLWSQRTYIKMWMVHPGVK